MEVEWRHKDIGREGELLDFLYSVTVLVICGNSVWMWMATGELGVVCLSGDAGSGLLAA